MPFFRPRHGISCQKIARRAYKATSTPKLWSDIDSQLRHLFRRLLRECRHLPDPAAHAYLSSHVRQRYRKSERRVSGKDDEHKEAAVQKARKALNQLRAANAGFLKPLTNALFLTYGRCGRRRHELLGPLRDTDKHGVAEDKQDPLRSVLRNRSRPPPEAFLKQLPRLTPPVLRLLRSQYTSKVPDFARKTLPKNREPNIPENDVWKRDVALKRVKNLIKKWHRTVLDRMLPPLEKEEWQRLRDLATGKLRFWGYDKRDRAIISNSDLSMKPETLVKGSLQQPLAGDSESISKRASSERLDISAWHVDDDTSEADGGRQQTGSEKLGTSFLDRSLGISKPDPLEKRNQGRHRRHTIDHRFMRRIWQRVFETCPMMTWNPEKGNWNVEWGKLRRRRATSKGLMKMSDLLLVDKSRKEQEVEGPLKTGTTVTPTHQPFRTGESAILASENTKERKMNVSPEQRALTEDDMGGMSKVTHTSNKHSSLKPDPEEDILNFRSTETLLQEIENKMVDMFSGLETDKEQHQRHNHHKKDSRIPVGKTESQGDWLSQVM
ncbi:MAG: hypothetical protein M1831_000317 [Alyxoria varia]|nr:MAG: hypothetical protein M1831_000317 [Alyxoria varia]